MGPMDEITRLEQQIDAAKQVLAAKQKRLAEKKATRLSEARKNDRKRDDRRKYIVGAVVLRDVLDATIKADAAFRVEVLRRLDRRIVPRDRAVLVEVLPGLVASEDSPDTEKPAKTDSGTDDPASTAEPAQTEGAVQ